VEGAKTYGEEPKKRPRGARERDRGHVFSERELILTRKLKYGEGILHEVVFSL